MAKQKRAPRGRRTKLTPALQEAIFKLLELGMTARAAAAANGVRESTLYEWIRKGEANRVPYAAFVQGLEQSRAHAKRNFTVRALSGGPGSSQALWLLEHCFPDEYGRCAVRGAAGETLISAEAEIETAEAIRSNLEALRKLHEAIDLTAKPKKTPRRSSRAKRNG